MPYGIGVRALCSTGGFDSPCKGPTGTQALAPVADHPAAFADDKICAGHASGSCWPGSRRGAGVPRYEGGQHGGDHRLAHQSQKSAVRTPDG
jgi:hypothetical protein